MNVLPVAVEGRTARLGEQLIALPGAPANGSGPMELGIRPEFVRVGREGMPASIRKVEDIGRQKIVRLSIEGREIAAILGEDEEVPAEARVVFEPKGINLYAGSWRVEMGA
jgi:glycerol transport system ATP-binding protein